MEKGTSRRKRSQSEQPEKSSSKKSHRDAPLMEAQTIDASSQQASSRTLEQKAQVPQSTENMQAATSGPALQAGATSNTLSQHSPSEVRTARADKSEATRPAKAAASTHELSRIFGNGPTQYMALFIATLSDIALLCHNLVPSVMAADVDHWCKQPAEYSNLTTAQWRNISTPRDADGKWLRCVRYDPPLSVASTNRSTRPCQSWDYGPGAGRSLVAQWDLVCQNQWLLTLSSILYMSGAMTAAPLMGVLSDKVGRRPVICAAIVVLMMSGLALCFTNTYVAFLILRFWVSAAVSTLQITSFVLLFELSTREYQCMYCVITKAAAYTTAPLFLTVTGHFVPNWTMLQILVMLPTSLLTCGFYITLESPHWLLSKKKFQAAEKTVLWAASRNGVKVADAARQWRLVSAAWQYAEKDMTSASKSSMGDTMGAMNLLRRGVIMVWCWFLVVLTYYGRFLARGPATLWLLGSKLFLQLSFLYLLYRSMMFLGRRHSLWGVLMVFSLLVGSSTLMSVLNLDPNLVAFINAAIDVFLDMAAVLIYVVSVEIFPTVVRSLGVFTCYFFGRIGGMAAPIFYVMGLFSSSELALLSLSFAGLLTSLLVTYLPETMTHGIVDTIGDLDESNRQRRLRRFGVFATKTSRDPSKAKAKKTEQQQPSADSK
ncbi:hypothetical protein HPB47_010516 [Ixodes persulcatus]|uniref:Uncharacterized protein n=1 Tax=Ixodes persulcatus TaxID=34615 RepID=A0AC60NYW9_IXOPE|nr:hypothetical protein HPB47_010516 [Ixodes persulcatus]